MSDDPKITVGTSTLADQRLANMEARIKELEAEKERLRRERDSLRTMLEGIAHNIIAALKVKATP